MRCLRSHGVWYFASCSSPTNTAKDQPSYALPNDYAWLLNNKREHWHVISVHSIVNACISFVYDQQMLNICSLGNNLQCLIWSYPYKGFGKMYSAETFWLLWLGIVFEIQNCSVWTSLTLVLFLFSSFPATI